MPLLPRLRPSAMSAPPTSDVTPSHPTLLQLAHLEHRLTHTPQSAELWREHGLACEALGRWAQALSSHSQALSLQPLASEPLMDLARVLRQMGQASEALRCASLACERAPHDAAAHNLRGVVLSDGANHTQALEAYRQAQALTQDPSHRCALARNVGASLQALWLFEEATHAYREGLAWHADDAACHFGLANALDELGQLEAALSHFEQGRLLDPTDAEGPWNQALALLRAGRYELGWPLFEARWQRVFERSPWKRATELPLCLSQQEMAGQRVLLHAEQGLGDTLQMVRFVPALLALGTRVYLEVQAPLVELLQDLPGVCGVWAREAPPSPLPLLDAQCPLMSLPLACGVSLDTLPHGPSPYLLVSQARRLACTQALGPRTRPRVGLCWSGGPTRTERSLGLAACLELLRPDWDWFALNPQLSTEEQSLLGQTPQLHWLPDQLQGFARTAALAQEMNLILTVDTSLAHLGGALGLPTWVMLNEPADWRWLRGRCDSPWYPTMRLFRQEKAGHWASVIASVQAALQSWRPA